MGFWARNGSSYAQMDQVKKQKSKYTRCSTQCTQYRTKTESTHIETHKPKIYKNSLNYIGMFKTPLIYLSNHIRIQTNHLGT